MNPAALMNMFLNYANQLKFRNLFLVVVALFIVDLLVPDFIPLIDEIILGLLAMLLTSWKKDRKLGKEGRVIEGEVVDEHEK